MSFKFKKMFCLGLTFIYVLSLASFSPAWAKFKDGEEAKWAVQNITKLNAKGVIKGYNDGSFRPNKPVTRVEALVMVLKTKGVTEQVYGAVPQTVPQTVQNKVYTPFKDYKSIPLWAKSFLDVAVKEGYLAEEKSGNFQPNKPATRAWVARLMVKVLGLSEDVDEMANLELPFNDNAEIDDSYSGYIALALENNLLQGYPDGTFKPNKPVTRAEMAVLLGNADSELELEDKEGKKVVGTVVYQATGTITIATKNGQETAYQLADEVQVFVKDQAATIADVQVNDRVEMILEEGVVKFIKVVPITLKGTVLSVVYGEIKISLKDGAEATYKVAEGAEIKVNGKKASLSQVVPGAKITLVIEADKVTALKAHKLKVKEKKQVKSDDRPGAGGKIKIKTR